MKMLRLLWIVTLCGVLGAGYLGAQETGEGEEPAAAAEDEAREEMEAVEETIVVTASRTEQRLHDVPASITVLSDETLEEIPADDYGDYLRNVPGLNVSQMSARDVQITGRQATNSLAASQLVLMDNRTLYLDFFGFVMWDFVPLDPKEIKQIEVVRGPGSAVWGANAMTGVINLITKSPREMQGTSVTLGGGELGTAYGSISHAGAGERMGYKVSASFYEQDPYDRPQGSVPGSGGPTNPGGTPYPPFDNRGTSQPKVNFRLDWDGEPGTVWSASGGYAGTDGIIHSGIGPFDIESGTQMSYLKADWMRQAQRLTFFVNFLDGDADNLLTRDLQGNPLAFAFESTTYDLDYSDTRVIADQHILTFGAKARRNEFDLSIAPQGDSRDEYGIFVQDEILLGDRVRWLIGARWDDIDPIGSVVSPRTTLMLSPQPEHTFRLSYNRAFRAPSMVQNFLDIVIVNQAFIDPRLISAAIAPGVPCEFVLTTCTPFLYVFPSNAVGNEGLTEEQLDAFEVGYVGTFENGVTFTASVYRNESTDSADFFTAGFYSPVNPPPGWPVFLLSAPVPVVPPATFPSTFSYRNIGETVDQGLELAVNVRPRRGDWSYFLNYSYQDRPEVEGINQETLPNGMMVDAVNIPPEHRINAGAAWDTGRWFANGNVNYVDEAFWTDVLDPRFWGPTDSYTMVNLSFGVRFGDGAYTFSINAQNAFDEEVQQHVFGDIISRKVTGQLLLRF